MKNIVVLGLLILALVMLSGYPAEAMMPDKISDKDGQVAGFWQGLWHGVTSPFVLLISFFGDNASIYQVHNDGQWYNLGFLLGILIILDWWGQHNRKSSHMRSSN